MHFRRLDLENLDSTTEAPVMTISKWHNETPRIWNPQYVATPAELEETANRLKQMPPEALFLMVAETDQRVPIGFIWANKQTQPLNSVMVMSLYTIGKERGKGIGTQLKAALEDWCREERIDLIQTTVHYTNHRMLGLNKKLGYQSDMLTMSKKL